MLPTPLLPSGLWTRADGSSTTYCRTSSRRLFAVRHSACLLVCYLQSPFAMDKRGLSPVSDGYMLMSGRVGDGEVADVVRGVIRSSLSLRLPSAPACSAQVYWMAQHFFCFTQTSVCKAELLKLFVANRACSSAFHIFKWRSISGFCLSTALDSCFHHLLHAVSVLRAQGACPRSFLPCL